MKDIFEVISLAVILVMALISDLKTGKIPNRYNVPWLVYGFTFSILTEGYSGMLKSLVGMIIPVVMLMVLFAWKVMGAGDIKLLSVVGTFLGANIFFVIIYSFLLCAVYGLIFIIAKILKLVSSGNLMKECSGKTMKEWSFTRVAFSPFIAGGFILYVLKGGFLLGI